MGSTRVEAAEAEIVELQRVVLADDAFEAVLEWLEEPAADLPNLRAAVKRRDARSEARVTH